MRTVSIGDFCSENMTVTFRNVLRQHWRQRSHFSCIGRPKRLNILVCFVSCEGLLRTKSGQEIKIEENGIMYAPYGAEYALEIRHRGEGGYTIGVNFLLADDRGEPVVFSPDVQPFRASAAALRVFEELAQVGTSTAMPTFRSHILLESLIYEIVREEPTPLVPAVIREGVLYLQEHYAESPSMTKLAAMSHVSEVYFRRLFKSAFLMSPAAYMTRLKLKKAAEHLEYGDMSVQEIAETVGYASASYFAKEFKTAYGCTPLNYRREKTER